ncbi:hypothetical protein HY492_00285 [Candidatus Woesearchaeota archaeon]|nr:hypothetical protein [Candidatus Woesearchaeota archaeon]
MKKTLTWLHPLDMALLLMLLEAGTFFFVGFLQLYASFHFLVTGFLAGVAGTVLALGVWHIFGGKIRGNYPDAFTLSHINVAYASVANGIFLSVLFFVEDVVSALTAIPYIGTAAFGFGATVIAVLFLLIIYNLQPWKLHVTIGVSHKIASVRVVSVALIAGLYEAIILPLMLAHFSLSLPALMTFALAGIVSGFIGGMAGTVVFNYLACLLRPWIELQ